MYCPLTTAAASERASGRVSHSLAAPDSAVHSFVKIATTTTTTAGCGGTGEREGARERERGTRQRATSIQNRKKKLAQSCTARHPLPLPPSLLPPRPLSDRVQESIRQKKESVGRGGRRRQMNRALMGCGQGNSGCTVFSVGWKCSPGRKKTTPNGRPPMDQPCFPHFIGGTLGGALDSFNNTYEY